MKDPPDEQGDQHQPHRRAGVGPVRLVGSGIGSLPGRALGTWVAEQALGALGPIRERYLPLGDEDDLLRHDTEVCWPLAEA